MRASPTQSRERVKGETPLQGAGTASLLGFGATPQLFRVKPTQRENSTRCRQRSVPASNFARPQTRPQAALPPRFREAPVFLLRLVFEKRRASLSTCSALDLSLADYLTSSQSTISPVKMSRICASVRPSTALSLFTMTAMPSMQMVTGVRPASSSDALTSREAMPMS